MSRGSFNLFYSREAFFVAYDNYRVGLRKRVKGSNDGARGSTEAAGKSLKWPSSLRLRPSLLFIVVMWAIDRGRRYAYVV